MPLTSDAHPENLYFLYHITTNNYSVICSAQPISQRSGLVLNTQIYMIVHAHISESKGLCKTTTKASNRKSLLPGVHCFGNVEIKQ